MITALLMALALVIGFIMGANAAKSKILHDIEMLTLDAEMEVAIQRQLYYQSNGRTVDGTFHHME